MRAGLVLTLIAGGLLATVAASASAAPFRSPSGNIGCYLDRQGVRCDIAERDWSPPPKPASCDLDYGQV